MLFRSSFVGIYGISGSSFELIVMVIFGLLGWLLRKMDIPLVPVIMGVILGNLMETNLRRAMTIYDGEWLRLLNSNVSIIIWSIAIIGFVVPLFFGARIRAALASLKKTK